MKKNILAGVTCLTLASTMLLSTASATGFSDVSSSHWASSSISAMADAGVMNGVGDGTFAPSQTISYAEFITMIVRQYYGERVGTAQAGSAWYTPYLDVAQTYRLLAGTSLEGDVSLATSVISRYDMATIITNLAKNTKIYLGKAFPSFTDLPDGAEVANSPHSSAVRYCYDEGLIRGVDDIGTFNGNGNMDRAQSAVVMERLMALTAAAGNPKPWDFGTQAPHYINGDNILSSEGMSWDMANNREAYTRWENSQFIFTSVGYEDNGALITFENPNSQYTTLTFTVEVTGNSAHLVRAAYNSATGIGISETQAAGTTKTYIVDITDTTTSTLKISAGRISDAIVSNMYLS